MLSVQNLWDEAQAQAMVAKYKAQGVPEALALRVYSSRLIGAADSLVLHGGGNTSVKGVLPGLAEADVPVLWVKGSGWDLATIEPQGFPAVRLGPLRALRQLPSLSDEAMVNALRTNLLVASAPTPSVEALLHAFLPHTYVDHTHADALLALVDQPDPQACCREVFGDKLAVLPFIFPGFPLAGQVMAVFDQNPQVEGIVLIKHGLFTFGDTAKQAYDRMIHYVEQARLALAQAAAKKGPRFGAFALRAGAAKLSQDQALAQAQWMAPIIRGALAEADDTRPDGWKRWLVTFRSDDTVREYLNGQGLADYACRGVVTPDHIIRTKNLPLVLPPAEDSNPEVFAQTVRQGVARYREAYHQYFQTQAAASPSPKQELDRTPRVVLVPGVGIFAAGASEKEALIAADLARHTVDIVLAAEAYGRYTPLEDRDLFEMEYWSLEQAKLGKAAELPLARQVFLVTGAGSGIGAATALGLARQGAHLVLLDVAADLLAQVAQAARKLGVGVAQVTGDVTQPDTMAQALQAATLRFGGLDGVVSNAGKVWQGLMAQVPLETLRESFELNFWAHQQVAAAAVRLMLAQQTGGQLLFNASKSAFNPGPDLGPYTLPKAAVVALTKQYAIEYGAQGIRANAVNADRVNTRLFGEGVLESRARARNLSVSAYLSGNLLQREVLAEDVAQAFLMLAHSHKTTGAVVPVDGGNIAAAPR